MADDSTKAQGQLRPGYVSQNFKLSEFKLHNPKQVNMRLVGALEKLRTAAGDLPITIHSHIRGAAKNAQVGGVGDSRHLPHHADAVDISIGDLSVEEMYAVAETIPEFASGGIGVYPNKGTIHVDMRGITDPQKWRKPARWGVIDEVSGGKSRSRFVSVEQALGKPIPDLRNPDLNPSPLDRLAPPDPETSMNERFDAYAKDAARADYIDNTAREFGPDVANHAKLLMGKAVTDPLVRQHIATKQAVQGNPTSEAEFSFFSDLTRNTPLHHLPHMDTIAQGLDFTGQVIESLLDPSSIDPVAGVEMLAGGGAVGSVVKKSAKVARTTDITDDAMKVPIVLHRRRTEQSFNDTHQRIVDLETERMRLSNVATPEQLQDAAFMEERKLAIEAINKELGPLRRERRDLDMKLNPQKFEAELEALDDQIAAASDVVAKASNKAKAAATDTLTALTTRRDRLAAKLESARKAMVPVKASDVTETLRGARSLIESARMGDEWRRDVAMGLVVGQKYVTEKIDALNTVIGKLSELPNAPAAEIAKLQKKIDRWNQVAARIGDNKVNIGTIMGRDMDDVSDAITATAEQIVMKQQSSVLDDLAQQVIDSNPSNVVEAEHEFMKQLNLTAGLAGKLRRSEVKTGQAQRIAGMRGVNPKAQGIAEADTLIETLESLPEGATPMTVAMQWRSLKDSRQREAYIGALRTFKGTAMASIEDVYLNSLIAGLGTPLWNIASIATLTAAKIGERAMMARFKESGVAPGEASTLMSGMVNAYWKLFVAGDPAMRKAAAEEFRRASGIFNPQSIDPKIAAKLALPTTSGSIFRSTGQYGKAVDALGHIVNLPRYLVASTDSFFRFAIKDAMAESFAYRQAYQEVQDQVRRGAQLTTQQKSALLEARQAEIKSDPNATIIYKGNRVKIADVAEEEASIISMMDDLKTPLGQRVDDLMRSNMLGRLATPFFRVMAVTARETFERAGPAAKLLPSVRADLAAGGERAASARAKMATGNMLGAVSAMLWANGTVTDGGPLDPELNRTWRNGHEPYTLTVGDTRIPLNRLGVVGEVMMYAADVSRALAAIPSALEMHDTDPEATAEKLMMDGVAHLVALNTALVGSDILFNDMQLILRAAASGDGSALRQVGQQRLRGLAEGTVMGIPVIGAKDIKRYLDGERKSIDGWLATVQRTLPFGTKGGVSTARNGWGDKTADFENLSPVEVILGYTSAEAPRSQLKAKVADELVRSGVTVLGPSRSLEVLGQSIRMNMTEWNTAKETFGSLTLGGKHVDEALADMQATPGWKNGTLGPNGSRAVLAGIVVKPYLDATKQLMANGSVYTNDFTRRAVSLKAFEAGIVPGGATVTNEQSTGPRKGFNIGIVQ